MSSFFHHAWASFDSKKWNPPNPELIRTSEAKCTKLSEVVLPVIFPKEDQTGFITEIQQAYQNEIEMQLNTAVMKKVTDKYPNLSNLPKTPLEAHYQAALRTRNHEEIFDRLVRMMASSEANEQVEKITEIQRRLYDALPENPHPSILCFIASCALLNDYAHYTQIINKIKSIDPVLFYKLKAHEEYRESRNHLMLRNYELACKQDESGETIFCITIANLLNRQYEELEKNLKKLILQGKYRAWAIQLLLTIYKDRNNHAGVEAILFKGFHLEHDLDQGTTILLADLHIQFFLRRKQYRSAWQTALFYKELNPNHPLVRARLAQILMRAHTPGKSIEKICEIMESALKFSHEIPFHCALRYELTVIKIEFALFIRREDVAKKVHIYEGHLSSYSERTNFPELINVTHCEHNSFLSTYEKVYSPFQAPQSFYYFLLSSFKSGHADFKKLKQQAEAFLKLEDIGEYKAGALFFKWVAVNEVHKQSDSTLLGNLLAEIENNSNPNIALVHFVEYSLRVATDILGMQTYEKWLRRFSKLPFVFTDFAKLAVKWQEQSRALVVLNNLLEKHACPDLWHALALLYFRINKEQCDQYLRKCENYEFACDVLARREYEEKQFTKACASFEKSFFRTWYKANPKTFYGDDSLDDYTKESVRSYVNVLMKIYQDDKTLVITHVQKFLDSLSVVTRWKKEFADQIHEYLFNTVTLNLPQGCASGHSVLQITVNTPIRRVILSNYSNPAMANENKSKKTSLREEIPDLFLEAGKEILNSYVDAFFERHEKEQDYHLKFSEHYKKAKHTFIVEEIAMHLIRMVKTQTKPEQEIFIGEIQLRLFSILNSVPNMEALFVLCVLSMPSSENPTFCEKLTAHYAKFVLLIKAVNSFEAKNYDEANLHLRECIKMNLNQPEPIVLLGLAASHFCKKEFALAAGYFLKLAKTDKNQANLAVLYALTCYKDTHDFDGIQKFLFNTRDLDFEPSKDVKILSRDLFLQLLCKEGRFDEALEWVQLFSGFEPNDPFLMMRHVHIVLLRLRRGQSIVQEMALMKQALAVYQPELFSAPLRFEFALTHAFCLEILGKSKESFEVIKAVENFATSSEKVHIIELNYLTDEFGADSAKSKKAIKKFMQSYNKNSLNPESLRWQSANYLNHSSTPQECIELAQLSAERDKSKLFHVVAYHTIVVAQKRLGINNESSMTKLYNALMEDPLADETLITFFQFDFFDIPFSLIIAKQWLTKFSNVELIFTELARLALKQNYKKEFLKIFKEIEQEKPNVPDLLHGIALLEDQQQNEYIQKCLSVEPSYKPICGLVARKQFEQGNYQNAITNFEEYFLFLFKNTQPEHFFVGVKISERTLKDATNYIKALVKIHSNKRECLEYIQKYLTLFKEKNDWFNRFKKTIEIAFEEEFLHIAKFHKSPRSKEVSHFEETKLVSEEIKQEPVLKAFEPVATILPRIPFVEQTERIPKSFLEPDAEEIALKERLNLARSEEKKRVQALLTTPINLPLLNSRYQEEDVIKKAAAWSVNSCELNEIDYPKKIRRFVEHIDTQESPPVIWERPPAAATTSWLFPLLREPEVKRLKQGAELLRAMEDFLNIRMKRDYNLKVPKDEFIATRLLMYNLSRLGECLFPTSARVKAKLSPVYAFTMEQKIISSDMIMLIRKQIQRQFMFVSLDKILNACEVLKNSNLYKNLERWYIFNEFSKSEPLLLKTVVPPSCQVIEARTLVPLIFLTKELRNLASLIDKVNEDVFCMDPDVIAAVKMSVFILGSISVLPEFRKIRDLAYYKPFADQIAYVFGEDYEGESFDEVSLFDIRPFVEQAQYILGDFFMVPQYKHVVEVRHKGW